MLKLTDLSGNPIYFNHEAVEVVRGVTRDESARNARAAVVTSACTSFVQETSGEIADKMERVVCANS